VLSHQVQASSYVFCFWNPCWPFVTYGFCLCFLCFCGFISLSFSLRLCSWNSCWPSWPFFHVLEVFPF
jgi:hypothetical protein